MLCVQSRADPPDLRGLHVLRQEFLSNIPSPAVRDTGANFMTTWSADFAEPEANIHALDQILADYRSSARTEREKGTYFERLVKTFLKYDPIQSEEYEDVWSYQDWAQTHGWSGQDIGIDLVAKLKNDDGYCAVQCKFYDPDHRIQKADIDGFLAASGKSPFRRRLIVDSTELAWGSNAEATIQGQEIPVQRLSLHHLRASRIEWEQFYARGEGAMTDYG
mgnify:CR=1 FL=1